jgi:hypothetical protein
VAASVVAPWATRLAVCVAEVCAVVPLWLESVDELAAVGLVETPLVAVAEASAFPCAFFGKTGAVAVTAVVRAAESVGVLPACAPAPRAMPGVETAAFVAVGALPDVVVGVVPESVLAGPDGPGGGASDCELAAMAAAAMARGAVGLPEAGAVAGALVVGVAVVVGTATATGVVEELPTCCARMVASTTVASASSSFDWESSAFEVPEVLVALVVDWLAPFAAAPLLLLPPAALAGALASEPALDDGPLSAVLPELSFACAGAGVLSLALVLVLLGLFSGAALSDAGRGASVC